MPLYTCPGCEKPISESQPLDHCLGCEAMNQRQNARKRDRSTSVSGPRDDVECIVTIILRRPSQQHGPGSVPPPAYQDPDMAFPWEIETGIVDNRRQTTTANNGTGSSNQTAPLDINQTGRP
ncbi:hypothetical protein NQ176_g5051 [Zarea fungicola]|uniref:Uncharacterized protein n=1 Tax=Zarea fungicola TaxID=93591 RepID=A0ACC1NBC2_9HYPO|nr:hypothetical protein NQ176_g5051 [Lecanicillium fungicola]